MDRYLRQEINSPSLSATMNGYGIKHPSGLHRPIELNMRSLPRLIHSLTDHRYTNTLRYVMNRSVGTTADNSTLLIHPP